MPAPAQVTDVHTPTFGQVSEQGGVLESFVMEEGNFIPITEENTVVDHLPLSSLLAEQQTLAVMETG